MNTFFWALIVATSVLGREDHPSDEVPVFRCAFDQQWDVNFDTMPDTWQRKTGPGYPRYVHIAIEDDETVVGNRCLTIRLDGGGASITSPPIPISSRYSYQLNARLKALGLHHDQAIITVDFFDDKNKLVHTESIAPIRTAQEWMDISIGPIAIDAKNASRALIGLHVQPGQKEDLQGTVSFDDVQLIRQPRIVVQTNSRFNVYTEPNNIVVSCHVSGIHEPNPMVRFELLDASSDRLDKEEEKLGGELIYEEPSQGSKWLGADTDLPDAYEGSVDWSPPIHMFGFGFYRVRVVVEGRQGKMREHMVSLAVVRPFESTKQGVFGWSLPGGENPLSFEDLNRLLPRVGIHWVKIPVWYREGDDAYGDRVLRLAEHLATSGIELVGVLDRPPADSDLARSLDASASISDVLSLAPAAWSSVLDPIMTRLSLRVRWWQLGSDRDTGFVGYPNIVEQISKVRKNLYRFGQDVNLGIAWRWTEEAILEPALPWEFLQYSADPALTGDELAAYLNEANQDRTGNWVLIEPLPLGQYSLETRTRDLVYQMLSARIHNAAAAFIPEPFSNEHGLMNDDGTPGELLLPWRTTAALLGGTTYLGQIQMQGGSHNHIFRREDGTVVMVIWNDQPTRETIFLGNNVRCISIWGREMELETKDDHLIIDTGPMPDFLIGLSEPVARWRMAVQLQKQRIPSVFSVAHPNMLSIQNPFPQGAGGYAEIISDDEWTIEPHHIEFKIASGEEQNLPFQITLPFSASSGEQQIRIDFHFSADRTYHFSVYRDVIIGLGDILLEVSTHFDNDGSLIVEQRMSNRTDKYVDFRCFLRTKKRRHQRSHVFQLGRGQDIQQYRFHDGKELIGEEFQLRAEEIGGTRVLIHRFYVEE
ncbi:MAG: hypothetical protein JW829_11730 [Pirellulales bacterium]|nr:hypothetical protein [Pirellulales bacterium]